MLTVPSASAERQVLRHEVLLVLGVSLAASAIWSLLRLVDRLTRGVPLAQQTAAMNVSRTEDRPWLDLAYQLTDILLALVPVLLALHLLNRRPGGAVRLIGLAPRATDLLSGAGLAALIGLPGLGLYVAARYLGISATITPANLAAVWWAVPVLILAAAQNALLEEVVGVGYLLTRLQELGWRSATAVGAHALLRGSYHLYQGIGGLLGNMAMGVIFVLLYRRWGRIGPLVAAHALIDTVAFVGYVLLAGQVSWLPTP